MNKTFKTIILSLSLFLSLAGSILFFPARLAGNHTCLYDQLKHQMVSASGHPETSGKHYHDEFDEQAMIHHYICHFAIFWWLSVGWLLMNLFGFKRLIRPKLPVSQRNQLNYKTEVF